MLQVLLGLVLRQRGERALEGDALLELPVFGCRQFFVQLGLAGNHDLDQLFFLGFEVRDQPQALDRFGGEVLRLVQHDDHVAARRHLADGEVVQPANEIDLGEFVPGFEKAEVIQHHEEDLFEAQLRVENKGGLGFLVQLVDRRSEQRGLARPRLADHGHKAHAFADGVQDRRQRLLVLRGRKEKPRLRGRFEWFFGKSKVIGNTSLVASYMYVTESQKSLLTAIEMREVHESVRLAC